MPEAATVAPSVCQLTTGLPGFHISVPPFDSWFLERSKKATSCMKIYAHMRRLRSKIKTTEVPYSRTVYDDSEACMQIRRSKNQEHKRKAGTA